MFHRLICLFCCHCRRIRFVLFYVFFLFTSIKAQFGYLFIYLFTQLHVRRRKSIIQSLDVSVYEEQILKTSSINKYLKHWEDWANVI